MANTDKNADAVPTTYPGGKGGAGVYQTIINLIPPHEIYIETHLGGGSIIRHKRPARINIGIDIDPAVIDKWSDNSGRKIVHGDALEYLKNFNFSGSEFIYCDPPYMMETRSGRKLYNFEYTVEQHIELLDLLKTISCNIMISGYWSELYAEKLASWDTHIFEAMTRGGTKATEWLWMNYEVPEKLHDYSFLGDTFRERERIKRKISRWVNRLKKLPVLERNAILTAINSEEDLLAGFGESADSQKITI